MTGKMTVRVKTGNENPLCSNPECRRPFDELSIENVVSEGGGNLDCYSCGRKTLVAKPPQWFDKVYPGVVSLIGVTKASDTALSKDLMTFHCYNCGAGLPIDGQNRAIKCNYCNNDLMIPDELWAKLHPAGVMETWFAVLDLGNSAGILPASSWGFCGILADPLDDPVIAWQDENRGTAGHRSRIGSVNEKGFLKWVHDGVKFSDGSKIYSSPSDRTIYLVDSEKGFVRTLNPLNGKEIRHFDSPEKKDLTRLNVRDHYGFAPDIDKTVVVLKYNKNGDMVLLRYDQNGQQVELWPGISEKKHSTFSDSSGSGGDYPGISQYNNLITISPAGYLYLMSEKGTQLAWFDRTGKTAGKAKLSLDGNGRIYGFGVDSSETVYILYQGKIKTAGEYWDHVAKLNAESGLTVIAGPESPRGNLIGRGQDHFHVTPSGRLVIAGDIDSMRILDSDGNKLRSTSATDDSDRENERKFKKASQKPE